MAVYDLEEQDQIDELKAWWTRYGGNVDRRARASQCACVIVGVQGWRWWTGKQAEEASVLYTAVSDARARQGCRQGERRDAADSPTATAGTGYAPRAALLFAKMLYDSGDKAGAKAQLHVGRSSTRTKTS